MADRLTCASPACSGSILVGGGEVVPHGPDHVERGAALATKWDDAQAAALAATLNSLHCDSVTSLKLHDNGKLTERGIEALLSTGAFDQLTVLDCRFTAITSLSSCDAAAAPRPPTGAAPSAAARTSNG